MTSDEALPIAESIAAGHAFDKHVVEGKEFAGISVRTQFQDMILEILTNHDEERTLERGRRAFWSEKHSAIVIVDPTGDSNGTAFRPHNAREYFRSGLQ